MKQKVFRIKNTLTSQSRDQMRLKRQDVSESRVGKRIPSDFQEHLGKQFSQMMTMFKSFMEKSPNNTPIQQPLHKKVSNFQENLEPRDKQILIDLPEIIDEKISPSKLKKWIASVVRTVFSIAFNFYYKNQMSFEQTKIFCSENVLKNIAHLSSNKNLTNTDFQIIDKHIHQTVLQYLAKKYPLTESTQVNKNLEAIVTQINNIDSLANNYFRNTSIFLQFRESGDYTDYIMRILNDVMKSMDVKSGQSSHKTNFIDFEEYMMKMFENVEDQEWMRGEKNKQNPENESIEYLQNSIKDNKFWKKDENGNSQARYSEQDEKYYIEEMRQKIRKKKIQKEKYKVKVQGYTNFKIGRKIPENITYFTEQQIQSKNFSIKSGSILRILTKWSQQLWRKFATKGYYGTRPESFRTQKGEAINSLNLYQRQNIDYHLQNQKPQIEKFLKELQNNNYEMQSSLVKRQIDLKEEDQCIETLQRICGKVSVKVVNNLHTYILSYLNKLIHALQKIAKEIYEQQSLKENSNWPSPPNLLSFRISDLMRCKCSSQQKQILKLYNEISRISKENPDKLKIVRIKNRLKKGTNDILINIKFNNLILCQIQLAVKNKLSQFIKASNSYSHFIYELQRSTFGSLTELCSIWNTFDQRIISYKDIINNQTTEKLPENHICFEKKQKFQMNPYQRPFICMLCTRSYSNNNFIRSHNKCTKCDFVKCGLCQISEESIQNLKQKFIRNKKIHQDINERHLNHDYLPSFGICILLESKNAVAEIFSTAWHQQKQYLLTKKGNRIKEIAVLSSQKAKKAFIDKYLVFQISNYYDNPTYEGLFIDQNEAKKKYILPMSIKKSYNQEKQNISLAYQYLTTEQCTQILKVGSKHQRQNVKSLFLNDNEIKSPGFIGQFFPNLSWLQMQNNYFQDLESLNKLVKLQKLEASCGTIKELPETIFKLKNLKYLSFGDCGIIKIDGSITNLKQLQTLKLDGNQLIEIPEKIGECVKIKEIILSYNQIEVLPEGITNLQKLITIDISNNKLSKIPQKLGKLKKLKKVNLSYNNLTALNEDLGQLQKLQQLQISGNADLNIIPKSIEKNSNLIKLHATNCKISEFPNITSLQKIIEIYLQQNSIVDLPQNIGDLQQVIELQLNNNQIKKIPISFSKLINLTSVVLSFNKISVYQRNVFEKMANIHSIDLSNNEIECFPKITQCRSLESIDMTDNKISRIPEDSFGLSLKISTISLDNNLIEKIPFEITQLNSLSYLSLPNNKIVEFEVKSNKEFQSYFPNLYSINLNQNKLKIIPQFIFSIEGLSDLMMQQNEIQSFDAIDKIPKLYSLSLIGNKIKQIPESLINSKEIGSLTLSKNKITKLPKFLEKMENLTYLQVTENQIDIIECPKKIVEIAYGDEVLLLKANKLIHGQNYQPPKEEEYDYGQQQQENTQEKKEQKEEQKISEESKDVKQQNQEKKQEN